MSPNRPAHKPQAHRPEGASSTLMWTEKLIELVLSNPALYNHGHPDFRNVVKRDVIWATIGQTLHTNADDVKKKWRSLRDTYSRILRNRLKKGLRDMGRKWKWADKMEPLAAFLPSSTYGDEDINSSGLLEIQYEDDSTSATQDSALELNFKLEPTDICEDASQENRTAPPDSDTGPRSPVFATSSTGERPFAYSYGDDTFRQSVGYFLDEKRSKVDPTDLLFLAYASAVKTFSPRRQAVTKLKIAEILMQEEIKQQEELESVKTE